MSREMICTLQPTLFRWWSRQ